MRTVIFCFFTAAVALAQQPFGDRPTYHADDFVASLGINASPFHKYLDSGPWKGSGTKYPPEFLYDLGLRAFRTAFQNELARPGEAELLQEWWRKTGVRPMFLTSPDRSRTLEGDFSHFIAGLKEYDPRSIDAISGPNEVNNKFPPQVLNLRYKGLTDEAAGAKWQQDMFAAVRAEPSLAGIPIINYEAIFSAYTLAEKNTAFDYLNIHSYQGSDVPSSSLPRAMQRAANILPVGAVIPPYAATECGYNVEHDLTNQQGYTGSRRAQALNTPMLFAEYFRHGIRRIYLFALHNADGYGLLESGQESKRPSWYAVKSFVDILCDSKWNPDTLEWEGGRDFTPRVLRFLIDRAPDSLHTLTLQKENGDWYLLIWNELRNYEKSRGNIINPPEPIKIRFMPGMGELETVAMYSQSELLDEKINPTDGAFAPVANVPKIENGIVAVSVPSHVVILQIRAKEKKTAFKKPIPPEILNTKEPYSNLQNLISENKINILLDKSNTTNTSVLLFRNGMHVETFTNPSLSYNFYDNTSWINPGLGYRYTAQSVSEDGTLSAPDEVVLKTHAKYPDLVIGEFGYLGEFLNNPLKYKLGNKMRFGAILKNIGDGATPNPTPPSVGMYNSSLTVTFRVDGKVIGWGGDNGQRPLAPGALRDVSITGGPTPDHVWETEEGTHILMAEADDIWRIGTERRRDNNIATKTITIGEYPGLLAMESRPAPHFVNLEESSPLDWVHFAGWGDTGKTLRKESANLISDAKQIGSGYISVNPGCAMHIAPAKNNAGLWGNCVGNGYEFEVPAGKDERTLLVYVSATNGGRGEFSAELSDGSAPSFADSSWTGERFASWASVPDEFSAVYRLRYRAASDGQTLKIRWKLVDEPNRFLAQIRLQAAVLYQ